MSTDPNYNGSSNIDTCFSETGGTVTFPIYNVSYAQISVPNVLVIQEGATKTISISVSNQPASDVVLAPNAVSGLNITPNDITFSNSDYSAKTFSIEAIDDSIQNTISSYTVTYLVTTADP